MSWAEFRTTFHGHHIPVGLMAHKLQEFLHLQQGSSSVYEYSKGFGPVLHEHLTLFQGCTLNELVSASIEQEDACHARLEEERKKRPPPRPTGGAPPKYHLVYTPPSGQPHDPPSS
jgi:DNA-directed RNA polymerase specialized sigma54-like protein